MKLKEWIDDGDYYNQSDDLDCHCYLKGIIEIPTKLYKGSYIYDEEWFSFDIEDYSAEEKMTETIIEKSEDEIIDYIEKYILYYDDDLWDSLPGDPEDKTYRVKVEISFYLNNIIVHEETAQDPDTDLESWIEVDDWDIDNISIDKIELLN